MRSSLLLAGALFLLPPAQVFAQHTAKHPAKSTTASKAKSATQGVPVVTITLADGPLVDQLKRELKREADSAAAHGQLALVDLGAPWCGPCRAFEETFHDSLMVASLRGARVIHLDFNTWYPALDQLGYLAGYDLPELFLLTPSGKFGDRFDKTTWSDRADSLHVSGAQMMGPPLQRFLADARAKARTTAKTP